jgi:hypothetical protein
MVGYLSHQTHRTQKAHVVLQEPWEEGGAKHQFPQVFLDLKLLLEKRIF